MQAFTRALWWIAAVSLVASPARASDPNLDDAARVGQLGPDPDRPRDLVLSEHVEAAEECWERAAGRRGVERSQLTVTYRVAANGSVRAIEVIEPARPTVRGHRATFDAARRCVLTALRRHRFAADVVLRTLGDRPEERPLRHTFVLPAVAALETRRTIAQVDGLLLGAPLDSLAGPGAFAGLGATPASGPVTPRFGVPIVRGSIATDVVAARIRAHHARLGACVRASPPSEPAPSGALTAHLVIGIAGDVTSASVTGGTVPDGVRRCMSESLARVRFPAPSGGGIVVVEVPVTIGR